MMDIVSSDSLAMDPELELTPNVLDLDPGPDNSLTFM